MESIEARFSHEARLIRRVGGKTQLETTMRKALKVLAENAIPHLIAGGMAVQERGYPRGTKDVDIIVPNVRTAHQTLLDSGFERSIKLPNSVVDPASEVEIDLLPGGKRLLVDQTLPHPMPTIVSEEPQIVPLDVLINMKLSAGRGRDLIDVRELIKSNSLPEDYQINKSVQSAYHDEWGMAHVEKAAEGLMGEF